MAKVLGESGRYVGDQTLQKSREWTIAIFIGGYVAAFLCGVAICFSVAATRGSSVVYLAISILLILVIGWVWRVTNRRLLESEKEHLKMRKGAVGEALLAVVLKGLSDDYWVIHDLSTPVGNLDHVVVGPTGVYLIDTKNWKGIVSADGHGELLLNGKPTEKATVRPIIGRTMAIREKVLSLCANDQARQSEAPFFNAVLAFPSAKVEANWGSTGPADCVSDEKLLDYIIKNPKGRVVSAQQVESYAKAFRALAQMDGDFEMQPSDPVISR